ncbi:hypothetical protein D9M73_203950 [compost metagenome]
MVKPLRVSSVRAGIGTRMVVPAVAGFKPRSEVMMAFSTAWIMLLSNTLRARVRESSTVTLATWRSGVSEP